MSNSFRRLLTSLTVLVPLTTTGWTDQNPSIPAYRSKTDVVLVPVVVRSKGGPAQGLKQEQFSVMEDGKPQKIASVELIKTVAKVQRREAPGQFSNELFAPAPARLTIVGLDLINTPYLDQSFGRQQLLEYLTGSMDPNEQVAIFAMYRDGSVRLLHDISSDSATLADAIKGLSGALPNSAADTKTTPTSSKVQVERAIMANSRNPNLGSGDPKLERATDEEQALQSFKESTSGHPAFELRRNMEATLSSMRQIGEAFSGAPGRKSFIWITGSFPFELSGSGELVSPKTYFMGSTEETAHYYVTHNGALPPLPDSSLVVNESELNPLRQEFRTLLQEFASGNIVLYPLDARGLLTLNSEAADTHSNKLLLQFDKERIQTSQGTMQTMAQMTGGKACFNKNEIVSCVRNASQDSQQYYLLSYYRDKKNNKQGWRKLSVKVDQPDTEVRARSGFFYGRDPGDKNARNRALSTAMRSSVPLSLVPFSAKFLSTTPQGNNKLVKYRVFIPPTTVDSADQGDNKFQLEIITVASTPSNPRVDQVADTLGGNLPPEAIAAIHQQGLAYNNVLKLPPGQYDVRFMVRNVTTNEVGSVIAPLKVD